MNVNELPRLNADNSETGCCPRFDPVGWDDAEIILQDRLFLRAKTVNFLHMPLNIGRVFKRTFEKIMAAEAWPADDYLILSTDPSPWRGEHFFSVTRELPSADMVRLSGRFLTKVFEGPYREAGTWVKEMDQHVTSAGENLLKLYFFYTTCPKCAKYFGKNYVVAFGEV